MPASFSSEIFTPDRLIAGNADLLLARYCTLAAGQNLMRGALLGIVTASGEARSSVATETDGSETPDLILAEDCDASAGAKPAIAYYRGDFNERAVIFGAGHTANSVWAVLRNKGMVLLPSTPA